MFGCFERGNERYMRLATRAARHTNATITFYATVSLLEMELRRHAAQAGGSV